MRVAVIGLGAVGARAARQLASSPQVDRVVVRDVSAARTEEVISSIGPAVELDRSDAPYPEGVDAVILATPAGTHVDLAQQLVAAQIPVVSVSDAVADVRGLLDLHPEAEARHTVVAVGAAFAPGLTCVLARHAAHEFDRVEEIHVARMGTGGPACARQHHQALGGTAIEWRDGGWVRRAAGSGRELCWFPDPVGACDCYRAELPDALLLTRAFPGVQRISSRLAATRRDRLTSRLPMMRKPHPEGGPGAVRLEMRGQRGAARSVRVYGAMDRPGIAGGAVAALTAVAAAEARLLTTGAAGLAQLVEPVPFLAELSRRGVKVAVFEGNGEGS